MVKETGIYTEMLYSTVLNHLDLDFYDHYFKSGAYPTTHKEHMEKWHLS
jgi:hypothetical protein